MRDKTKYNAYINSPEWREKRRKVLDFRGCKCQRCLSEENLQIHHGTYRNLYKEKIADLFVLCYSCHVALHTMYGTKDLLRATKAFIKGVELIPRKKRKRLPLEERRKFREDRRRLEVPKAIEAIKNGIKFKQSGVSSIKNWKKALKMLKESEYEVK